MKFSSLFKSEKQSDEKVFCMRRHCTSSCEIKSDRFKPWADFFSFNSINRKLLFNHITELPNNYRAAVYKKCIGDTTVKIKKIEIIFEDKSKGVPNEVVDQISLNDSKAMRLIFSLAKPSLYGLEEKIFDIYKHCCLVYGVKTNFIPYIVNMIKIPNMDIDVLLKILTYLIEHLRLLDVLEVVKMDVNKQKFDSRIRENILTSNNLVVNTAEFIFFNNFDLFTWITDLAFATNKTYREVIEEFINFSHAHDQEELIKILKAKSNFKFLKLNYDELKKPGEDTNESRRSQNYFDFLIVQDNLIKAQEKMKEEYEGRIMKLEESLNESVLDGNTKTK